MIPTAVHAGQNLARRASSSGTLLVPCASLACYSERRPRHVTEGLFSSTFALHALFVFCLCTVMHMRLLPVAGGGGRGGADEWEDGAMRGV